MSTSAQNKPANVFLIGLTGGIACGKSVVLSLLRKQGANTLDADHITHQLQRPGTVVHQQIVATFGPAVMRQADGTLDRARLGALVFSDPAALQRLEQIMHPAVRVEIGTWLSNVANAQSSAEPRPVAVIDAIKLLEAGWHHICDQVWVITCLPEQQIARLMRTRGMSEFEARNRINVQPPQDSRLPYADVVIDNSGTLDNTRAQVTQAWDAIMRIRGSEQPQARAAHSKQE